MKIIDIDKDFLEVVDYIFTKLGYNNSAYEDLGSVFADCFMDVLADAHIECKKDKGRFMALDSIEIEKPSITYGWY